jgi:hypothetical protein
MTTTRPPLVTEGPDMGIEETLANLSALRDFISVVGQSQIHDTLCAAISHIVALTYPRAGAAELGRPGRRSNARLGRQYGVELLGQAAGPEPQLRDRGAPVRPARRGDPGSGSEPRADEACLMRPTGDELREARRKAGLTQAQVARAMGIAQPHISTHERGEERPGPGMVERYRSVYGPYV